MDAYQKIKLLGKGSFGKVYLMKNIETRSLVCTKTINVRGIPAKERDAVKLEVTLMRKLDHPNIVRYHQSVLLRERGTLCIVMEFCDGGDLEGLIKRSASRKRAPARGHGHPLSSGGMSEAEYMPLFVQVALGLEYLHANRVLHRDLKTANIFLLGNGRLVLGDLGISKVLDGTLDMARTKIGTPYYMAPEIFKDLPYSAKADVWALGCVLFEMVTGKHAFEAQSIAELMRKVMAGRHGALPPSHGSGGGTGCLAPPLRALLGRMLDVKASARPTVAQVLRDPALRNHVRDHFQDMASRPSGKVGSGTADIQQALLDAERHGAAGADSGDRSAASLRTQLERLGVDRHAIVEAAEGTVGSAACMAAKAPAVPASARVASARAAPTRGTPSDARSAQGRSPRSPPSQRAASTAASKAVSRYGHAAVARQQAAQQKQPASSRYGQQQQQQQQRQPPQQHQLIARQHYVRGALAREEQRRRQVESALQRLRRERVSLAAAGGRGAGDAYYGAAAGGRGAMVSPRLQGGAKGVGARGNGAAAIATPSRLLAKQQAQEQRVRAAREARRDAEQQTRRRVAKAQEERRQAQAKAQADAKAQALALAQARTKAKAEAGAVRRASQHEQQQQHMRKMQFEADARFARMLQDQEDKQAAVAAAAAPPSSHALRQQRVAPTGNGRFVQQRGVKENARQLANAAASSGDRKWMKQGRAIASEMDAALAQAAERRGRSGRHSPSSSPRMPIEGRESPSCEAGQEDADDAIRARETELQAELGASTRICRDLRAELAAARKALGDEAEPSFQVHCYNNGDGGD